ncbi:MAG: hypothetical protein RL173_1000 [Fibrobacterota bacterium]|jgi:hypothetical protein
MEEASVIPKILNISCLKATQNHSRKMDGALGLFGNLTLRGHFVHCPPCAEAAAQVELIRKAMRSVTESDKPRGDRLTRQE